MTDLSQTSVANGLLQSRYALSAALTGITGNELALDHVAVSGLATTIAPFFVGPPGPPGEDSNKLNTTDW